MARKETKRRSETNGQAVTVGAGGVGSVVRELAQVFKLLSDETRLRILFYLALSPNGELHVTDLCQRLGQSQPAVSHHLALLRVSGLIESRREGQAQLLLRAHRSLRRPAPVPLLRGRRSSPQQEVQVPRLHPELLRRVRSSRIQELQAQRSSKPQRSWHPIEQFGVSAEPVLFAGLARLSSPRTTCVGVRAEGL